MKIIYLLKSLIIIPVVFLISCSSGTGNDKDKTAPGAVSLSLTSTETSLNLSWTTAGEKDIETFRIFQSTDNVSYEKVDSVSSTDTEFSVINLEEHTLYYYKVTAVDDSDNESDDSNIVSGELVDATAPGRPQLSIRNVGTGSATLQWTGPSDDDIDHFEIEQSEDNSTFAVINNVVAADADSFVVSGLTDGITYYFRMRAVDGDENAGTYSFTAEAIAGDPEENSWTLILNGDYENAIELLSSAISSGYIDDNTGKAIRGWAYLFNTGGDNNSADLNKAIVDFKTESTNDNAAGLTITYSVQENYYNAALQADIIHALASYQHPRLADINQVRIRLHGAFAYWNVLDYDKTKQYLDAIEPAVDHSTDPNQQLDDIQRLNKEYDTNTMHVKFLSALIK